MLTSQLLETFIYITGVFFGIIAVIFLYLIIKRKQQQLFYWKVDRYIQGHNDAWYTYLIMDGAPVSSVKNEAEKAAVDQIFVTYMTTINNKEVRQRIAEYATQHLQSFYVKQLKSTDLAVRLNVLQRMLLFDLSFLRLEIENRMKKKRIKSMEEYNLCMRVVSNENSWLFLAHMYKPCLQLKEYEYKVILSQVDVKYIEYFMNHFKTAPIDLKLALLDYLSLSSNLEQSYLLFYENQLSSIYKEIRIRALKTIASFGLLSDLQQYEPFVRSQEWEERLMLAKVLRFSNDERVYQYLQQLMKDSNWKVRKQAAMSLNTMRGGVAILEQIIQINDDKYATDMAKEILKVG